MVTSARLERPNGVLGDMSFREFLSLNPELSKLGTKDLADLKHVLVNPYKCVHNRLFDEPDAERLIFIEAPEIPEPSTGWYNPDSFNPIEADRLKIPNIILSARQEQVMFLQFNYARFRVKNVLDSFSGDRLDIDEAREILKWHRVALIVRGKIASFNLALVLAMAKRARAKDLSFSDKVSEGNESLLRAIDGFNVGRGFKFSTYACRAILKAFGRSGMKETRYRQTFDTEYDPALGVPGSENEFRRTRTEGRRLDSAEALKEIVSGRKAELTEMEHKIIVLRFGFGENGNKAVPLTLEQIGRIVGLTKERVRQIQCDALEKLRQTLEWYNDGGKV